MNSGPAACIIGAVITIALVFAAQSAAAAIPSSPEIAGRVVEAGTGKPIAGALVTGHIGGGYSSWFGHGGDRKLHCFAAMTDGDGRFRIPGWSWTGGRSMDLDGYGAVLSAYHRDYTVHDPGGGAGTYVRLRFIPLLGIPIKPGEATITMRRFDKDEKNGYWFKLGLPIDHYSCDWDADVSDTELVWNAMREEVMEQSTSDALGVAGTIHKLEAATKHPLSIKPKIIASPPARIEARVATMNPGTMAAAVPMSLRITRVLPDPASPLRVGDRVKLTVEASYSTPSDMPVTLVVQAPGGTPLISNVRETVKAGSGTVTLKADFVVPETDAIEIYLPFSMSARPRAVEKRRFEAKPRRP